MANTSEKAARRKVDHRTRVGRQRSAQTETRILAAALEVFADMGPDAPKIDDFVQAAGISRGTFYNHFESVEELLAATSEWTTRETVDAIESAIEGLDGVVLRFGVGLRLVFRKADEDPLWARFVARVWKLGGVELPVRDLAAGLRAGAFTAPSLSAARDLVFGGAREALLRIGSDPVPSGYGEQMAELCLQALGVDPRQIAAAMNHELPSVELGQAPRRGKEGQS